MKGIFSASRKWLVVLMLIIALLVPVACTSTPVPTIPPEVTQYAKDWPLPNRDYANSRATKDSTINSGNVQTLAPVWAMPIMPGLGSFGSAATTPLIMGNTVYFQDLGNNFFALDLTTGAIKWKKMYNDSNVGPNGPAVGWGKVFGTINPYYFAALDMNTGEELWTSLISHAMNEGQIVQPTVYGGLAITATTPSTRGSDAYSGGAAGWIYALDQNTGEIVWSWDTVDSADFWGNADYNSGGGMWYSPSIDTDTGTVFLGTGNPSYPPIKDSPNGSTRPGPNLYSSSLVALGTQDGSLKWYTQVVAHDQFDYDFQIPPILTSANINGTQQDIVIGAGKMGRVVAFNRQTGAILWETIVGQHQNDQLANLPTDGSTVTVLPGSLGGVETPMAYADGVVYVPVVNLANDYTISSSVGHPLSEGTGELVAIQVDTGKILWDKTFNTLNVGGATVANDLVFTTTFDGMIYALKRDTGEQVWSYQAPGSVNAWPAFAGDTMVLPVGLGAVPGLMAFKLSASSPVLAINPGDGFSVTTGDVTVSALVENFTLADKLGQANVAGEGHLHYFLDVDAPTTPGQPAIPPSGSIWAATASTSYTFNNVAIGTHTISVELVNNDHTPLSTPVVVKATVNVTALLPAIQITTPANFAYVTPGDVTISVNVANFNLVDKLGQPAALGEGHIHYYIDVPVPTMAGQPATTASGTFAATTATSYTWHNVSAGPHEFMVQLVNNDNTPLDPRVVAEIVVVASNTYTGVTGGGLGQ